jgi:cation transport regulator ChaB
MTPARDEELPSTLARSPAQVRRTYEEALDNAHRQYGDEERAHRTAWAAVKHIAEKKGDHWELKDEPGPRTSGPRAAGASPARAVARRTAA